MMLLTPTAKIRVPVIACEDCHEISHNLGKMSYNFRFSLSDNRALCLCNFVFIVMLSNRYI